MEMSVVLRREGGCANGIFVHYFKAELSKVGVEKGFVFTMEYIVAMVPHVPCHVM